MDKSPDGTKPGNANKSPDGTKPGDFDFEDEDDLTTYDTWPLEIQLPLPFETVETSK